MIRYMVIDKDTHRDDCFTFHKDLERALAYADRRYHEACHHYKIPYLERFPYTADLKRTKVGRTDFYCGRSPCDSFCITVEEVEIPE